MRRIPIVPISEFASIAQRNSHGGKVLRRNDTQADVEILIGLAWITFDLDAPNANARIEAKWKPRGERDSLHARQQGEALLQSVAEGHSSIDIAVHFDVESHVKQMAGIKAQVDLAGFAESLET